jgi:plastocyanin
MMKTTALVAAAALGLAACGSSSSDNTSSSSSSAGGGYGAKAAKTTKTTAAGTSPTEVDMHDNFFQAKTITGKAGSTIKVKLKNVGNAEHNFKIDSQLKQADADLEPGKTATVSVTIPKSGTLQFYCEYHKGLGMVGTVKPS